MPRPLAGDAGVAHRPPASAAGGPFAPRRPVLPTTFEPIHTDPTMPELFLELLSEEIPARMQRRAAKDLARLVTDGLAEAGLVYEGVFASATPRRLMLSVQGLPARSPDRDEERRGPRVGAPQKALDGFVRSAGLASIDEAQVEHDAKKGDVYVARKVVPGRETIVIAAQVIESAVRRFPWPVSMRWGETSREQGSLRWVRPLRGILATFGPENETPDIVPVDLPEVPVGDTTVGHRFHAPGSIRVRRLEDYKDKLAAARVVVDLDRRRDQIRHEARDLAFARGLTLVEDEGLLEEVAGLVEWPVVLVGRFAAEALALPEEVIRLTIRENQKCFVTREQTTGRLADTFVLVANVDASDGGTQIVAGNERVVRARLADARFFWEQDRRIPLDQHARKLAAVTFHDKLGSQADRVERIAALAEVLAPLVGADVDAAVRAARLSKADLVTLMVGEFPELQGYMGRRYGEAEGLPAEVTAAIEEHYAPLGPNDSVPQGAVSVAVALADKVDTLASLWAAGEKPTGSGDPYGLRRAALGIIRLVLAGGRRIDLRALLDTALAPFAGGDGGPVSAPREDGGGADEAGTSAIALSAVADEIVAFVVERLIVQQREAGVPVETVRAVVLGIDHFASVDLVDLTRRIAALNDFLTTENGANLIAGYRRAANILRAEAKKSDGEVSRAVDRAVLVEPQEIALADGVAAAREGIAAALEREDYEEAMRILARLRAPVDAFFEGVLVNAPDTQLRLNRLRMLAALREVTRQVADFAQVAG